MRLMTSLRRRWADWRFPLGYRVARRAGAGASPSPSARAAAGASRRVGARRAGPGWGGATSCAGWWGCARCSGSWGGAARASRSERWAVVGRRAPRSVCHTGLCAQLSFSVAHD